MKDIANKNEKELMTLLEQKSAALTSFRFGIAGSKVRNVREGRGVRKDIARILTALNAPKHSSQ